MVSMQSGVDVGARAGTGEGVSNVRGEIYWDPYSTDVGALCPPSLSTPIQRTDRTAVQRLQYYSPGVRRSDSLPSIFNISCIGHLMSHGTLSLHIFSSFFIVPQCRHPSAYKQPALQMTSFQTPSATLWQVRVTSKQLCSVACWMFWHSRSCWVNEHRLRAWSSAAWALRSLQARVIPYSSAGK